MTKEQFIFDFKEPMDNMDTWTLEEFREYYKNLYNYALQINTPCSEELKDWFRCNSCLDCKFRKVIESKGKDIHWCSATHERINIIDIYKLLDMKNI